MPFLRNNTHASLFGAGVMLILMLVIFMVTYLCHPYSYLQATKGRLIVVERRLAPSEKADFDWLISHEYVWKNKRVSILCNYCQLANYTRGCVKWRYGDSIYREYVLSPIITGGPMESLAWRRELWEAFFPRVLHESDPAVAAQKIVRFLRQRLTVAPGNYASKGLEKIWSDELCNASDFEHIYVAAMRASGIAARLNNDDIPELYDDGRWQQAPRPIFLRAIFPKNRHDVFQESLSRQGSPRVENGSSLTIDTKCKRNMG
jgi:hypothetical protein